MRGASLVAQLVKNLPAMFDSWVRKFPWRKDSLPTSVFLDFPAAQMIKNLHAIQETWVQSLGWKDTLKEGMATHSSILAWRIPMDVAGEEHGRLQSTESDTAEQLSTAQHRFTLFRPVTFATTHPMVSY